MLEKRGETANVEFPERNKAKQHGGLGGVREGGDGEMKRRKRDE